MTDLKPCPFLVRLCSMDGQIIGYTCKGECANCPAEDALNKELTEQAANYENIICEYKKDVKQAVEQIDALTAEIERLKAALDSCRYFANNSINCFQRYRQNDLLEKFYDIRTTAEIALKDTPDTGKRGVNVQPN